MNIRADENQVSVDIRLRRRVILSGRRERDRDTKTTRRMKSCDIMRVKLEIKSVMFPCFRHRFCDYFSCTRLKIIPGMF